MAALTNLLLAAKAIFAEPTLVDGEVHPLSLNSDGRLRVASKPGQFPPATKVLKVVGATLAVDVRDASNIMIHAWNNSGSSMSAGAYAIEGSLDSTDGEDGTWFPIQAVRSNVNTIASGTTGTVTMTSNSALTYALEASINACVWVRIRCTTAATASSNPTWTIIRGTYATEPIPAIQTHPVTGSGNFLIAPATGLAYQVVTAATTNASVVKSSAGNLTEISAYNPTASPIYIQLYSKGTTPAPATDTPIVVIPVPADSFYRDNFGILGKRFTAGIGISVTGGPGLTNTTPAPAGAQVSLTYI